MRMMPFRPPTEYYDERLEDIDAHIAELVAERHTLSEGNPGFPRAEYLNDWAVRYDTPLRLLQHLFAFLHHRPDVRERVEPEEFLRFVPLMSSQQHEGILVMVPHIRQYNNCSVVLVELEGPGVGGGRFHHVEIRLTIEGYDSVPAEGSGTQHHADRSFIVTPPIPDDEVPRLNMTIEYQSRSLGPMEEDIPHSIPPTTVRFAPAHPPESPRPKL